MPRRRCPPKARLVGSYEAPDLRVGDREHCLYRDGLCQVTSYHGGPIPWPQGVPVGQRGRPALIVTDELVHALRAESAAAVHWHWNLSVDVVARYRKAFGVTRTNNPRSNELIRANSRKGGEASRETPPGEAVREARRRKAAELSRAGVLTHGYRRPWWTDGQLALLGTMPDGEVAAEVGRNANAVRQRRNRPGVPTFEDRRRREARR